jgi:tetratricopeptide (TPR) repeat protein
MAAALGDYWFYRGHFSEGTDYLERALTFRACPRALLWAGRLHQALGEYAQALQEFERSAALSLDPVDRARASNARAQAGFSQGEYEGSLHFAHSALALWQDAAESRGVVDTRNILATAYICLGRWSEAEPHLHDAERRSRKNDYSWGLSGALYLRGLQALFQGRYTESRPLLKESLELCRALGNAPRMAACLGNMGLAATATGDREDAHRFFSEGIALAESSGYKGVVAFLRYGLGYAALQEGHLEAARDQLKESLRILLSIRVRESAELVLLCLAAAWDEGETAEVLRGAALAFKVENRSAWPAYLEKMVAPATSRAVPLDEAMRLGAGL